MKIAAIVLAAGGSTRLGQPKQLVRLENETLVRRISRVALEAGCSPVIVVVADNDIARELSGLAVEIVQNEIWQEGISSSIRAGVRKVQTEGAILLTCDQPLVRPKTLADLMALQQASGKPIVASAYADTLGIPALFDRSSFPELLALRGDHGAKGIILSRRGEVTIYDFPEGAIDIDTQADLQLL